MLITLLVSPKEKMARHEVELKIDNLNVEDLLDEHRYCFLIHIFAPGLRRDRHASFASSTRIESKNKRACMNSVHNGTFSTCTPLLLLSVVSFQCSDLSRVFHFYFVRKRPRGPNLPNKQFEFEFSTFSFIQT